MLRIPTFLALALAVGVPVARAADEADMVDCHGEAPTGDDAAVAKDRALKAAMRDCIEKKFGVFVASATQVKDYQLMKDQILTSAQGFVSDYKITSEKSDDKVTSVDLKAKVSQAKIDEDAKARGLTLQMAKFPRIAVLISEQHINQSAPSQWWGPQGGGNQPGATMTVEQRLAENNIINVWKSVPGSHYQFVDLEALSGKLKQANVVANPSESQIKEYGNLLDADLIIFGTAVAAKNANVADFINDTSGQTKGMVSCKASISVRAFFSDSGEILATADVAKTEVRLGDLDCERIASKNAATLLGKDLERKILFAYNERLNGAARVRLMVKGVDFGGLKELKAKLADYKAVQAVTQKSFKDGAADIDLKVDGGDAEALADEMSSKGFGKVKAKVTGVTGNTITLEVGGK